MKLLMIIPHQNLPEGKEKEEKANKNGEVEEVKVFGRSLSFLHSMLSLLSFSLHLSASNQNGAHSERQRREIIIFQVVRLLCNPETPHS